MQIAPQKVQGAHCANAAHKGELPTPGVVYMCVSRGEKGVLQFEEYVIATEDGATDMITARMTDQ